MGNSLDQYRGAIGSFYNGLRLHHGHLHKGLSRQFCTFWLYYLFLASLGIETDPWVAYLITLGMDIEKNPGPRSDPNDCNIRLCNINLRSINAQSREPQGISRLTAFRNAVVSNYEVITCTETWLKNEHPDNNYKLYGYQGPFRLDRSDNTGHGGRWQFGS